MTNERHSPSFDDISPMPFGKHKGEYMQDVPAQYLRWWWLEGAGKDYCRNLDNSQLSAFKPWILEKIKLANYIWNNRYEIEQELDDTFI